MVEDHPDEQVFEIEFHDGNVSVFAVLPVPDIGQDEGDPVRQRLHTFQYRDLPIENVEIEGVEAIVQGSEGSDTLAIRATHVELLGEGGASLDPDAE